VTVVADVGAGSTPVQSRASTESGAFVTSVRVPDTPSSILSTPLRGLPRDLL
jgi:hypothetical protein